jgi:DNA-binding response OmpR family regulator
MPSRTSKKIVVLEDDLAMREIVKHKLSQSGFDVKVAEDGSKGYLLIEQEKPDLVLMDIMMPNMDGYEVLKRLRAHHDKKIAEMPVIVLSNLWSKDDVVKAQKYNVQDYMIKAYFTPDEILAKINAVLDKLNI